MRHSCRSFVALAVLAAVLTGCSSQAGATVGGAESLVSQGMEKINEGDYELALELFDSAIGKDAESAEAYRGRGIVLYHRGAYDEAIAAFEKALELFGNSNDNLSADTMKYYAECLYETGRYEEAVVTYNKLIDNAGGDVRYLYYMRGSAYVKLHNENQAVLDYEKALEGGSDNYGMCSSMYECFMSEGYEDRARSYLIRLLNSNTDDRFYVGKIYYRLGEYDKAMEYLKTAYNLGETGAIYYLALCMEATGQAGISDLYESHIEAYPVEYGVYNQYAAYLINSGNYEKALSVIKKALSAAGENLDADVRGGLMFNEGVCYEYLGDFSEALKIFEEYVKMFPDDRTAYREYQFLLSR